MLILGKKEASTRKGAGLVKGGNASNRTPFV